MCIPHFIFPNCFSLPVGMLPALPKTKTANVLLKRTRPKSESLLFGGCPNTSTEGDSGQVKNFILCEMAVSYSCSTKNHGS